MNRNSESDGLKRALRYFIRQAEVYVVCILAGSIAVALYQKLINGDSISFQDVICLVPGMLVFLTFIVIFVISSLDGQVWYSVPVSFGCRRRNVFLGTLVMNFLVIAQSLILVGIMLMTVVPGDYVWLLPFLAAVYFIAAGGAQFFGIAVIKWGKIAYILFFAAFIVCLAPTGVLFVAVFGETDLSVRILRNITELQWWAVFAGVVIWALANMAAYRFISSYEVRV